MTRVTILVLFAGLAGCATIEVPPPIKTKQLELPSVEMVELVRVQYLVCLTPFVSKYDDKLSDASTISKAVAGECLGEYDTYIGLLARLIMGQRYTPTGRDEMKLQEQQAQNRMVTQLVLQRRVSHLPK